MKSYINIFLTLLMPLSILFTAISVVYYTMDFAFSKAIKLGIVTGVLSGTVFSLLLALIILLSRKVQSSKPKVQNKPIVNVETIPKIFKEHQKSFDTNIIKPQAMEKKFILLMDKELAYEVSLHSMQSQDIGEIIYQNKDKGLILLKDDLKELKMDITTLTKHTAEILVTSTLDHKLITDIMTHIKNKELLFLKY